ncbi:MAG TPA: hypothetical protein VH796_00035 [Nitrososphaeraceae archaeon]
MDTATDCAIKSLKTMVQCGIRDRKDDLRRRIEAAKQHPRIELVKRQRMH